MTPREFINRLRAWRRDRLTSALSAELDAHVELLARDLEHDGMHAEHARLAARRQLGNVTVLKESSRDAWGFPRLESVVQDLRYTLRGLRQSPGFTLTVVVTLGLGIGANAAMFAVIDRLMFRPFPHMRDPDSVHRIYVQTTINGRRNAYATIPYARYLDLISDTVVFSARRGFGVATRHRRRRKQPCPEGRGRQRVVLRFLQPARTSGTPLHRGRGPTPDRLTGGTPLA